MLSSIRHYILGEKIVKPEHTRGRAVRMKKKVKTRLSENWLKELEVFSLEEKENLV